MKAVGIDIGTTSICAVLIDCNSGEVIKSETLASNAFIQTSNTWEKIQDAEKIIRIAKGLLDNFITTDTVSIGITGQMHGIVYFDESARIVSPLYTWQDARASLPFENTTYAGFLGTYAGYGMATDFYNRKNNLRAKNAVGFCTIHDYFAMSLCARKTPFIHSSDAASLGLFDVLKNSFTCDYFGDTTSTLDVVGEYKSIPVSVAIGDNQASFAGSVAEENAVLVNVGTGSQISIASDIFVKSQMFETRPYFENKYLYVGAALCGGRALSILERFFSDIVCTATGVDKFNSYPAIDTILRNKKQTSLQFDNSFSGTRTNPEKRGSIMNVSIDNFTPADFTFGILNGIADELFEMFLQMNCTPKALVGSGNAVRKMQRLREIFEKRFSMKLKIPLREEEAAFGAAIVSMVSAKLKSSLKEAQELIKYC